MRGAFVVQLGPETRPTEGQFEGWVEEVDSGTELRYRKRARASRFHPHSSVDARFRYITRTSGQLGVLRRFQALRTDRFRMALSGSWGS